jgi:hypothetical protein
VILLQDSNYLTYDRITPNGSFNIRERIAKNLKSKPKIVLINLFELKKLEDKDEKIKFAQEVAQIPLVGASISLEDF